MQRSGAHGREHPEGRRHKVGRGRGEDKVVRRPGSLFHAMLLVNLQE